MNAVKLMPVYISALLLGSHFMRLGYYPLVIFAILFPFILFVKKRWSSRSVQIILIFGSLEWIRTLYFYLAEREAHGESWIRLFVIIGSVALFTMLSSLVFMFKSLKEVYK